MGLTRTIGTAVVLAGAFGSGLFSAADRARADGIDEMIAPGSVQAVQLLGEGRVLTADEAESMLESEGFRVIESGRTLLGRIRIVAESPQGQREIVLHAGDGRVLRDLFTESEGPAAVIRPAEPIAPAQPPIAATSVTPAPSVPVGAAPTAPEPVPEPVPVSEPVPEPLPVPEPVPEPVPDPVVQVEADAPPSDPQDGTGTAP